MLFIWKMENYEKAPLNIKIKSFSGTKMAHPSVYASSLMKKREQKRKILKSIL